LEKGLKIALCVEDLQDGNFGTQAKISGVIFTPEFPVQTQKLSGKLPASPKFSKSRIARLSDGGIFF
jgi:hypothetical protein